MRRFTRLGLDVEITELDVGPPGGGPSPVRRAPTARAAAACAAQPRCTGLTVWGVTDKWSWIGEDKRALPFDEMARPKPALRAVARPLGG